MSAEGTPLAGAGLPTTMRAALLLGIGGPDMLEVRDDVPVPVPGADEVLIGVGACGLNNTDINTRVGWYSKSVTGATSGAGSSPLGDGDGTWAGGGLEFPRIQGADPSGRVVAVGSANDRHLIGKRVLVDGWIRDAEYPERRELAGYLGSERDGGFAEYVAVPVRNAYVHRSALSDAELATFPCSWSTAEHMLTRIDLRANQSIAITGASGGVGSALVSLAKLRGAHVVAITASSKVDAVSELGADAVVSRSVGDLVAHAVSVNRGPFDAVADVVGGSNTPAWFEALRRGGKYVTAGAIAGPIVELDLRTLYLNDLELYGATIYDPAVFANLVRYIDAGSIQPALAMTFPLERIHEAQAVFERKEHVGAIAITIAE